MMNSRWQANKIGLINFWYYDEQEFPFVKGRMLLRGSNGSGKSVTMQSVVPLLLDGNMSPERLDPFGSRDRKMSSYLLEEDDGREERTGYLYLELKRQNSDHQVAAIKGFLDKNDMEGLRGYCDDLELEEMGKVTIPYTGNAAADGVLYHYGCIARAKNIEFSVCCYLKDIAIPDTDFCTILGNALDNAVTAAGQYDGKRFIEVATEKKHDMLLITVDNSFDGILFQENGKIYSKKRQNKQEGIGILSMKKLCEKHGGASRFEAVGNRFQASFILKNEVED